MFFEFLYDDQAFLIELNELIEKKDKMEVFSLNYGDNPDDADEYEIKMFLVEGENLKPLKVTELPKDLLDFMGEELKNAIPETFFANPYFDELMVFYGNTVLTSKDMFSPYSCNQCSRRELYEKRDKKNKADYIQDIQSRLGKNPNPKWPFKGRLQIQFSVSDKLKRLKQIDLDNLSKAILDSLQGVVFENDAQIDVLIATKAFTKGLIGNMIAIKELNSREKPKFQQFLYSTRHKTWREEYKRKEASGKPTRFGFY